MCKLLLTRPSQQYAQQVMSYKKEMEEHGDSFAGCAGLEDVHSFEEWIDFETRLFYYPVTKIIRHHKKRF